MKNLIIALGLFFALAGTASATCVQAHTFVTGETLTATILNANPQAEIQCINSINNTNIGPLGIFASQIIPTTVAQAAFGGAVVYKFPSSVSASGYNSPSGVVELNTDNQSLFLHATAAGGFFYFSNANGSTNSYLRNDGAFFPGAGSAFIAPGASNLPGLTVPSGGANISGGITDDTSLNEAGPGTFGGNVQASSHEFIAGGIADPGAGGAGYGDISGSPFVVVGSAGTSMNVVNFNNSQFFPINASAFNVNSDFKLKRNIAPLPTGMSTIMALKPVDFYWKSSGGFDEGFIAQDVKKVLPFAVTDNGPLGLTMNYDPVVANLVAAVQTQQQEIRMLRSRLDRLEHK